jgi:hypothetical protein
LIPYRMTNPALRLPPTASESFYISVRTYRNRRTFAVIAMSLICATPLVLGVIHLGPTSCSKFIYRI